jgi:rhodanese-related sulfurtransferase
MNDRPDVIVLDVRTPAEVQQQVLDGALNIDFMQPDFAQQVAELDKNKTYLVYCRSGNRSGQACQLMAQRGFSDLHNLHGGLMMWPY